MVVFLWKFLWKKTQASLHYIKIGLCIFVSYLLIVSVFAKIFQTNKKNIYSEKNSISSNVKTNKIRELITNKQINSSTTGKIVVYAYRGLACFVIGEACYTDLDKKNPSNMSSFISSVFVFPFLNPPASGIGATAQVLAQAGFIPKSYAAEGVGFASIRPLMNVWKSMRDVAYLLLVLVIVTIGFMIMLRSKINPQTIVNVENSLPKIVMALIYITFSFAIAGFLIDLMYVSIVMIIGILGPEQTTKTTAEYMTFFLQAKPLYIVSMLFNFDFLNIFWKLPSALLSIMGDGVNIFLRVIITGAGALFLHPYVDRALAWAYQPDLTANAIISELNGVARMLLRYGTTTIGIVVVVILAYFLIPVIIGIIIFFTVLMLFFRIFMLLFSDYIKLMVLIIISPLYLLLEAVPGQSTFGSWIKNILELLVTFPVIVATSLLGSIMMQASINGTLWTPPFLIGLESEYLSAIIGMWVIFMIPDFIGIVKKAVNPKPLPLDAGLGTFFGGAKTGIETGLGEAGKYALLADRIKPLGRIYEMFGMGNKQGGGHK